MTMSNSIFPDLPRETPAVDKEGNFSFLWSLGMASLFQALQKNFKNEGIMFPPLTDTQMTSIQNLYASFVGGSYQTMLQSLPDISGQTVFDSTTSIPNQFVIAKQSDTVILANWVPFSMMLTHSGNPNGSVAGVLNWFCYDTSGHVLYACTTTGNAASAVWTAV